MMRRDIKIIKNIERLQQGEGILLKLQPARNWCGLIAVLIARDSSGYKIKPGDAKRLMKKADALSQKLHQKNYLELEFNEDILRLLIEGFGFKTKKIIASGAEEAIRKLYRASDSWPVITSVSNASHWVVVRANRINGPRKVVCVSDPERTQKNLRRTATCDLEEKEFIQWWRDKKGWWEPKEKKRVHFFGLVVMD